MMKKTSVIILASVLSLVGTIAILFLKPDVNPQFLSVAGEVTKVDDKGNVIFLTVVPDNFQVVSFEQFPSEGNYILHGRLQNYKGRIEFIVDSFDEIEEQND